MARAIWSGSISFGLVNVPVKLFSAVSPKEVHFHMVHAKDGARIKQKRICSEENTEVPYEQIAKGYEVSPGQYVVISPEELEKYDPKATRSIDIEQFVQLSEIDPIYYQATYYLAPDRGAAHAYGLLLTAMKEAKRVGIARVVLRTKQYLCAIRPMGDLLALSTMLYADEINDRAELEQAGDKSPRPKELQMAGQLIDSLSEPFHPKKYKDEYREQVLALIRQKAEGKQIRVARPARGPAKVVNLMDALAASLAGARKEPASARGERRSRAQAARASGRRRRKAG